MRRTYLLLTGLICLSISGCMTQEQQPEFVSPRIEEARALYTQKRYTEAIIACIDLAREDPLMPGLPQLQREIMQRLTIERQEAFELRKTVSQPRAAEDVVRNAIIPETYRIRERVATETGSVATPRSKMEQILKTPISVHLPDVTLSDFILEIGQAENINILADGQLSTQTMTIHADDTPLREILDFVSRNLGVTFSVGENMLWVTAADQSESGLPLETRVYRLRKGLSNDEIANGADNVTLVEAIERFVPQAEGSDLMFDTKAHALIVRNTRSNIQLTENIIDALDVTPPQVLIEARFLLIRTGSMRELGVDWVMNSDWSLSDNSGDNRIIVPGAAVGAGGVPAATLGTTGRTVAQGLTATVQGILTDPQFSAIIYALENDSNAETLSVPRITVINNREATIRIGRDFYYYEEWDFDQKTVSGDNNNVNTIPSQLAPVGSPTKEELGYGLTVTPSVGSDGFSVGLKLKPEVTDFVDWSENEYPLPARLSATTNNFNTLEIPPLPVFERREVETELVVGSGETVVMGGLIDSHDVVRTEGIPILSSIPLLGRLFMTETVDRESNNLLIFVTATVIAQSGQSLIPLHVPQPGMGRSSVESVAAEKAAASTSSEATDADTAETVPEDAPVDAGADANAQP